MSRAATHCPLVGTGETARVLQGSLVLSVEAATFKLRHPQAIAGESKKFCKVHCFGVPSSGNHCLITSHREKSGFLSSAVLCWEIDSKENN